MDFGHVIMLTISATGMGVMVNVALFLAIKRNWAAFLGGMLLTPLVATGLANLAADVFPTGPTLGKAIGAAIIIVLFSVAPYIAGNILISAKRWRDTRKQRRARL
ncbi:MAG: hypothetical protein JW834_04020 [Candidatus Diapherotrites archaeon]|nr:hypothetical protein [Candidatus Diapherotrites archaeon]